MQSLEQITEEFSQYANNIKQELLKCYFGYPTRELVLAKKEDPKTENFSFYLIAKKPAFHSGLKENSYYGEIETVLCEISPELNQETIIGIKFKTYKTEKWNLFHSALNHAVKNIKTNYKISID
jgi:hypothetical protein